MSEYPCPLRGEVEELHALCMKLAAVRSSYEAACLRVDAMATERDGAREERDTLKATLLARHGGEPLALLAELDAAREAQRRAEESLRAVQAKSDRIESERDSFRRTCERLETEKRRAEEERDFGRVHMGDLRAALRKLHDKIGCARGGGGACEGHGLVCGVVALAGQPQPHPLEVEVGRLKEKLKLQRRELRRMNIAARKISEGRDFQRFREQMFERNSRIRELRAALAGQPAAGEGGGDGEAQEPDAAQAEEAWASSVATEAVAQGMEYDRAVTAAPSSGAEGSAPRPNLGATAEAASTPYTPAVAAPAGSSNAAPSSGAEGPATGKTGPRERTLRRSTLYEVAPRRDATEPVAQPDARPRSKREDGGSTPPGLASNAARSPDGGRAQLEVWLEREWHELSDRDRRDLASAFRLHCATMREAAARVYREEILALTGTVHAKVEAAIRNLRCEECGQ